MAIYNSVIPTDAVMGATTSTALFTANGTQTYVPLVMKCVFGMVQVRLDSSPQAACGLELVC